MKTCLYLGMLLVALVAAPLQAEERFSMPPEWLEHEAVWIDFVDQSNWGDNSDHEARFEVITALLPHVPVKVLIDNSVARAALYKLMDEAGMERSAVTVIEHPIPNSFMRDAGPIFVTDGESLRVADFAWNCYGMRSRCQGNFGRRGEVANDLGERYGWSVQSTEVVAEGGGLEVSSNALMAYKDFAMNRNPGMALEDIEAALLAMYGKQQMIWVDEAPIADINGRKLGNVYGFGANGHIDTTIRFVNDNTLLVSVMDEASRDKNELQARDYDILNRGLAQIRAARDVNGKPFNVIEIPVPDVSLYSGPAFPVPEGDAGRMFSEHKPGDLVEFIPAMSYANFLITNGAVLVPEYWQEGLPESERLKDQTMKQILAEQFPNREIIGLKKALQTNWSGGGVHCSTQQQPKVVRLAGTP